MKQNQIIMGTIGAISGVLIVTILFFQSKKSNKDNVDKEDEEKLNAVTGNIVNDKNEGQDNKMRMFSNDSSTSAVYPYFGGTRRKKRSKRTKTRSKRIKTRRRNKKL